MPPKGTSAYGNATYVPRHAKLSGTLIRQQSSVYTGAVPAVGELISFHTLELHWQTLEVTLSHVEQATCAHTLLAFI